jgi:Protein of unknown function (DUF3179)
VVHTRSVENQDLTFLVSGKLWRNSLVMQDEESGSLWSHITGECLEGKFMGSTLEQVPSIQTTWSQWQSAHPATRVLKKSEEIQSSQYQKYFDDPDRMGIFRAFWLEDQMPGKNLIHGITLGPHALAITEKALLSGQGLEYELGDVTLLVSRGEDGGVRAVRADDGQAVLVRAAYWFAWSAFYPNTEILD